MIKTLLLYKDNLDKPEHPNCPIVLGGLVDHARAEGTSEVFLKYCQDQIAKKKRLRVDEPTPTTDSNKRRKSKSGSSPSSAKSSRKSRSRECVTCKNVYFRRYKRPQHDDRYENHYDTMQKCLYCKKYYCGFSTKNFDLECGGIDHDRGSICYPCCMALSSEEEEEEVEDEEETK
jgi:hypothetical protein